MFGTTFQRSGTSSGRRRTLLRVEPLEDRVVPAIIFDQTYAWTLGDQVATVRVTVDDAASGAGNYLWNYHVTNNAFDMHPDGIGIFAVSVGEPEKVTNIGTSTGWNGYVGMLTGDPNLVSWHNESPGPGVLVGQSASFWFTTPITEIVESTGFVSDAGFAFQVGGAAPAPIADPFMVTTTQDVVNPADGVISLREAIRYANSRAAFVPQLGFQIRFDPVVFGGAQTISLGSELPALSVRMSILGTGMNTLTIAGGGQKGIFTISTSDPVNISNLTVRDGLNRAVGGAGGYGGGFNNQGNLTLNWVRILNCRAEKGGGINTTGPLTMSDCEIIDCVALTGGGVGDGIGAGLHVGGGLTTISYSEIRGCIAADRGGGIAIVASGHVQVTGSNVLMNRANTGAGLYNSACTLSMSNCSIMDNTATQYGGGIQHGGTTTLNNVTLRRNIATGPNSWAGGLYLTAGTFTMTGGVIEESSAVTGGAIYVKGGTNTFSQGVVIRNNSASGWGGVSYSEGGTLEFNGCSFYGNQATLGAPLFARKGNPLPVVTVTDCDGANQGDVVNAP
jgi:CSLREA domain-containing protein